MKTNVNTETRNFMLLHTNFSLLYDSYFSLFELPFLHFHILHDICSFRTPYNFSHANFLLLLSTLFLMIHDSSLPLLLFNCASMMKTTPIDTTLMQFLPFTPMLYMSQTTYLLHRQGYFLYRQGYFLHRQGYFLHRQGYSTQAKITFSSSKNAFQLFPNSSSALLRDFDSCSEVS